jgi:hypothetical protein
MGFAALVAIVMFRLDLPCITYSLGVIRMRDEHAFAGTTRARGELET